MQVVVAAPAAGAQLARLDLRASADEQMRVRTQAGVQAPQLRNVRHPWGARQPQAEAHPQHVPARLLSGELLSAWGDQHRRQGVRHSPRLGSMTAATRDAPAGACGQYCAHAAMGVAPCVVAHWVTVVSWNHASTTMLGAPCVGLAAPTWYVLWS